MDHVELKAAKVVQVDHYKKVAAALLSPETLVFIDTSMLFWLYALSKGARSEFFSWVKDDLHGRFCIPVWSAHELQRYLATKQADLTPLLKHQKILETNLKELTAFLSLYVDESGHHVGYPDRASYFAELSKLSRDLQQLTSGRVKPDWKEITEEIVPFINKYLLSSNFFPSLVTIREEFAARVEGRVPPGFDDDLSKEQNKFGDLVIWNEIVRHCEKTKAARNVVLLTNDNKRDWVYRPQSVLGTDGKSNSNQKEYETLLASPLLVHELGTVSKVTDLHLINATALTIILQRYGVRPSPRLFDAVQPLIPDVRPSGGAEQAPPPHVDPAVDGSALPSNANDAGGQMPRLEELLSATGERSPTANSLLARMTNTDPTVQAIAVQEVLDCAQLLEVTDRDLFAIGRCLASVTEGRLQAASNLIRHLADATALAPRPRLLICAGLFHGLYFDESGIPRPLPVTLDSESILALTERIDLAVPVRLLVEALEPRRNRYLILPSVGGPPPTADLTFSVAQKALNGRDQLLQLLKEDLELLEYLEKGDSDTLNARLEAEGKGVAGELLKAVARRYCVRRAWLTASVAPKAKLAWVETLRFRNLSADP